MPANVRPTALGEKEKKREFALPYLIGACLCTVHQDRETVRGFMRAVEKDANAEGRDGCARL